MRLSTRPERDDDAAVETIVAALEAGVRLLDTADAYAHHDKDVGHNERLVARALRAWSGDDATVTVATKGGLTRPGGRWVPDGRAKHLRTACEASLRRLDLSKIALYQLHAPDPKVALATSVRALARLQRDGLVDRLGLSNVSVAQIDEARAIAPIASVQVEVGPYEDTAIRGGVASYCREHGIDVLAHRPLAGIRGRARLAKDPVIREVADRLAVAPGQVVLAWLRSFWPGMIPLPGPSRMETARGCAALPALTPADLGALDARFAAADILRRSDAERRPPDDADGDVVIVMGIQAAGKSSRARVLVDEGYLRLNRDNEGGRLSALVPALDEALAKGTRRVVLDNTYASRARRNEVVETAWRHGVPVRCLFADVPIERARIQAVERMLDVHGGLLGPEDLTDAARRDPNTFGPRVQLEFQRKLEPPVPAEGFVAIERFEPVRGAAGRQRLLLFDIDATFGSDGPTAARREAVARWHEAGWRIAGYAWRPDGDEAHARDRVDPSSLAGTLRVPLSIYTCAHPGGPPVCWCRPPMPGLPVLALRTADADAERSVLVGEAPSSERFALACGLPFWSVDRFASEAPP